MGPHSPSLPTLTHETTSFLLSLHTRPVSDEPTILAALLSLFLALIDLNVESGTSGEERLVTDFASQVMELRDWAGEDVPEGHVTLQACDVMPAAVHGKGGSHDAATCFDFTWDATQDT